MSYSTHQHFHVMTYFFVNLLIFVFIIAVVSHPSSPLVPASASRHHLPSSLTLSSLPACCPAEDSDSKGAQNGKDGGEEAQNSADLRHVVFAQAGR